MFNNFTSRRPEAPGFDRNGVRIEHKPQVTIEGVWARLAGNFAPEWKQLVDAASNGGDDAAIADAARELVECVLQVTK